MWSLETFEACNEVRPSWQFYQRSRSRRVSFDFDEQRDRTNDGYDEQRKHLWDCTIDELEIVVPCSNRLKRALALCAAAVCRGSQLSNDALSIVCYRWRSGYGRIDEALRNKATYMVNSYIVLLTGKREQEIRQEPEHKNV